MIWMVLATMVACDKDDVDSGGEDTAPPEVDCSTRDYSLVPSARGELQGVWDTERARLVLFGGNQGVPEECSTTATDFVDDTWAWNADCGDFAPIAVTGGDAPSARGRFAAAVDEERGWMLVHGGRTRDGDSGDYTLYDELWALDLEAGTWTMLAESGPGERVSHSAVVSGGQLIVFGGNSSANGASYKALGDTWAFDLESLTWSELDTSGDGPDRLFHGTALSDDESTLYVYAGGDEGAFLGPFFDDLWSLDLGTLAWSELHSGGSDAPDGRLSPNLVVDTDNNRLISFAGHDDGSLGNTNQVWAYDLGGGAWSELEAGDVYKTAPVDFCEFPADFTEPDMDSPERRYQSVGANTGDGRLIVFGGKTDCGVIDDVWTYSFADDAWTEESAANNGEICLRAFAECSTLCF